jgi:preprotein translocase subunit SecG
MAIVSILLTAIIIIVSILIVLIVLVQRPKQEGLGAAFGGGAFDSALGAHTTDVLQKITTYFAVIFFVSAVGLAMVKSRQFSASPANNVLENVDKLDAKVPEVPSGISNIPGLENEGGNPTPSLLDDLLNKEGNPDPAPGTEGEEKTTEKPAPDAVSPEKPEATPEKETPAPDKETEDPAEAPGPDKPADPKAGKGGE